MRYRTYTKITINSHIQIQNFAYLSWQYRIFRFFRIFIIYDTKDPSCANNPYSYAGSAIRNKKSTVYGKTRTNSFRNPTHIFSR